MTERQRTFDQLWRDNRAWALRQAHYWTRGELDESEDLLQETGVKAWRGFHTFTVGTNFRAWVARIMSRVHVNRYRQQARRPVVESWNPDAAMAQGIDVASPDHLLEQEEFTEEMHAALAGLLPVFREAVVCADVHGMSYREIARLLDVPDGTAKSRIHRGRLHLQRSLASQS